MAVIVLSTNLKTQKSASDRSPEIGNCVLFVSFAVILHSIFPTFSTLAGIRPCGHLVVKLLLELHLVSGQPIGKPDS
jgi:hypothetical protein